MPDKRSASRRRRRIFCRTRDRRRDHELEREGSADKGEREGEVMPVLGERPPERQRSRAQQHELAKEAKGHRREKAAPAALARTQEPDGIAQPNEKPSTAPTATPT